MQSIPAISTTTPASGPQADRRPPYSLEAEMSVLGGMLIDADAVVKAVEIIDETMFFREAHRRLFRAMVRMWEQGSVIEPVTLSEQLKNAGDFDSVGGAAYLAQLWDYVPTAANVEYHAKIVREKALLRRLIEVSSTIIQDTYENQGDVDRLLDEAESRIFQIAQSHERKGFVWIKELLWPAMEQIEILSQSGSAITGVPSGFGDLDALTAGFQKGDLVIVAARPSMGKCLAFDSEIVLKDGSIATIEDVYHSGQARLLTLGDDLKLEITSPSHFVDDGEKPVFAVTTRLGRRVEATLPHPFLTVRGWKRLDELRPGDRIAVPRRVAVFGSEPMRDCEAKLLGYLLGDGGLTGNSPRFTNADPRVRADFDEAVTDFGGVSTRIDAHGGRTPTLCVRRQTSVAPADGSVAVLETEVEPRSPNVLTRWLSSLGMMGSGVRNKEIPAPVFRLPRPQLCLFLNRLFATDGWATVLTSGQAQLGYASTSERLARQTQHLLLRFGIIGSLRPRQVKYRGTRRPAWQLDITDARSIRTFAEEIGIFGKEDALQRVMEALETRRYQTNRDLIPVEVWERIEAAKGDESWASLARRAGIRGWTNVHVGKRALTRDRLAVFARALDDAELSALAESDVYWDEIVSIEPMGRKQVYDLTIPDTHNFVANDVCVHNTAFTLNVAQHAAISAQRPVAFFSLEMSKESLVQRMLTSEARVDASRVRTGRLRDDDYPRLAQAAGLLNTAPIYIDDTPGISILEMRAKARRLKSDREDLYLIVVDYLQLMTTGSKTENRQQEVSEISRGLKALAKELDVPVVALSQLSRAVESRPDKRPMMSDLRESGAIEQDSDVIMFLYRPEYYYGPVDKDGNSLEGKAEVIIGKQRNGATGNVALMFHKEFTRFESFSYRSEEPGP